MKLSLLIALRLYKDKTLDKGVSSPAVRIATLGITLGLAVMILAVAIVVGFRNQITDKVTGFNADIAITSFTRNTSLETPPITLTPAFLDTLRRTPLVRHVQEYATKPHILKTDSAFLGVALKGVTPDYDWTFLQRHLLSGTLPTLTDTVASPEILISQHIANKLHLQVGDELIGYFVMEQIRARRFRVVGIYATHFVDYDKLFVIGDARQIQRLNGWLPNQYSGIEVAVTDFSHLAAVTDSLRTHFSIRGENGMEEDFLIESVVERNPQLFSWLELLNINVWVILALMSLVAGFTMVSGLLIIILERVNTIGVLKALGANNATIRSTFLYLSAFIIVRGLLWGNLVGISLCLIQYYFSPLALDPTIYYLSAVPIELNLFYLLLLNIFTLLVSLAMLIAPSYLVSVVRPAKSIKWE